MTYDELLAKQLSNPDGYLWFPESWPHSQLDGMARDFIERGSAEGYLSAVVIFHQLAEEILRLLIRYSNLLVRAKVYPEKIELSDGKEITLGKLIGLHSMTLNFKHKSKIIRNADQINNIRIMVVHKVLSCPSEPSLMEEIKTIQTLYQDLFDYWLESMKWFYEKIEKIKQSQDIKKLIDKHGKHNIT